MLQRIEAGLSYVNSVLIYGGVAVTLLQIVGRDIFNWSPVWTLDMATYMAIWAVFLGLADAEHHDMNLSVSFLAERLPRRLQAGLSVARRLAVAAVAVTVAYSSLVLVKQQYRLGVVSATGWEVPMYLIIAVIPLGMLLLALESVMRIWTRDARTATGGEPQ